MRTAIEKFNGDRLQEALDARMWSVSMLSDMSDISSSMLYYLINDEKKPSYETLEIISKTLKLPHSFFLKERNDEETYSFFRSYKRSTKALRRSVETKLKWISDIKNFLSSYVEFPRLNILDINDLKERDPRTITSTEIENLAQNMREYWGLGHGVITNTTLLLENNGIFLTRFMLGSEDVDANSRIGMESKRTFILLASDKNSRSRAKFDNAHELGHLILHSNINPKQFNFGKKENHDLIEEQANRFAGSFLLPEVTFARDFTYPTLESFKTLKSKWKVSIGLLIYRAHQIGLITDRAYKNLQINISKRGWRTDEQLEEMIEFEAPCLAKGAFQLLFEDEDEEERLTVKDMEDQIGLFQTEIEKISGLDSGFFDKYKNEQHRPKLRLVK